MNEPTMKELKDCATCPFHAHVDASIAELKMHSDCAKNLVATVEGIRHSVDDLSVVARRMSDALVGTLETRGMVPRMADAEASIERLEAQCEGIKRDVDILKEAKTKIIGVAIGASLFVSAMTYLLSKINWLKIL